MDRRVLVEVEDLEVLPAEKVAMEVAMEAMAALAALAVQEAQEVQESQEVCPHRGQLRHQRRQLGGLTPDSWRSHPALMARLRSGASGD